MSSTIPLTEARNTLPKIIKDVKKTMDRVTITKKGKPCAVLISFDEYESIIDTIEILSNPKTMASLRRAKKQMTVGKGKTLEQIEKEFASQNKNVLTV
ncbi:MAG: hypothetical protein A3D26_02905 [Candidatus Blackburnbacteria bacterium RIFCSPHIGHO2_02_FULL_44_20]|uniref:Antitoxin n=1 Tax=Candidatus Blackburnbacteria bacterium RIFCSPHIGHO2_02_FULL_44_20 TaxID=1797516 RepID=A0A1G1V5S7_9BACT|nr:MAG: hypothetical protein A3D26_02905 [Candidatus Blackburnbacteria bacterium RIFCSPHIGHO2_02_FULL_44_20]OGY11880.1 MAG: hypothetical protein A3E16_03765 [Candidatus Blackburnbacteria bacterium RIFCSPHIGHO2_12_FULL_44_25]